MHLSLIWTILCSLHVSLLLFGSTLTEQLHGPRLRVGFNFMTLFQTSFPDWFLEASEVDVAQSEGCICHAEVVHGAGQASVHTDCSVSGSSRVLGTSSSSQTESLATCSTVPAPHPDCLHTSATP